DPDLTVRLLSRRTVEDLGFLRQRMLDRQRGLDRIERSLAQAPPEGKMPEEEEQEAADEPKELENLRKELQAAVDPLVKGLSDPAVSARMASVDALELMGLGAMPAAPALARALGDCDRFVRWAAARVLGKMALLLVYEPNLEPADRKARIEGLAMLALP